jgi:probable HAF family extracellular repeat protein
VLWLPGLKLDMGTLGGPNSESEFAPNLSGQATGHAETSVPDPLGEDHCGWGTHLTCLPFIWQYGFKIPLPTLGGNNGGGVDINNAGQVVGAAETQVHDPSCIAPQVLQYLPAVWERERVRALPTLEGDPDGAAIANNDNGQAAGYSGNCGSNPFAHALLWEDGKVIHLGSLGGAKNNGAQDMNNLGVVVGFSDLPDDTATHAVVWRNGKVHDLGTLPGDVSSYAYGINNLDQVVGASCDADNNCTAFLWQNGTMTDLNALLPADSSLYLVEGLDINDFGEIVGDAYQQSTGQHPAFLAVPLLSTEGTATTAPQLNSVPKITLPESVRKSTQRQRGRFGVPPTTPQ